MAANHQIEETQTKIVAESERESMEVVPEVRVEVPVNKSEKPMEGKGSEPNSELDSVVASIVESIGTVEAPGGGIAGAKEDVVDKVEGDGTSGGGTTEVLNEKRPDEVADVSEALVEKDTLAKENSVVEAKPINTVEGSDSLDELFEDNEGNEEVSAPTSTALKQLEEMTTIAKGKKKLTFESDDDDEVQVVAETPKTTTTGKKRKGPALSVRFQPPRSGKKPKTSAKKDREIVVHEPAEDEQRTKNLLEEFEISGEWFLKHRLEDVWDLIKFQKWEHLFEAEGCVDTSEVLEFYRKITKVQRGAFVYLHFEFRG